MTSGFKNRLWQVATNLGASITAAVMLGLNMAYKRLGWKWLQSDRAIEAVLFPYRFLSELFHIAWMAGYVLFWLPLTYRAWLFKTSGGGKSKGI